MLKFRYLKYIKFAWIGLVLMVWPGWRDYFPPAPVLLAPTDYFAPNNMGSKKSPSLARISRIFYQLVSDKKKESGGKNEKSCGFL